MLKQLGVLAAALFVVGGPQGLGAQGQAPGRPTRVPVTVALVERLPQPGEPFVVLRRADGVAEDVILLPATADAAQLSVAVQMLLVARQVDGDTASTRAFLRQRRPDGGNPPRRVLPWAQRVLNDLRSAAPRPVADIGNVPAVRIWLPPQRRGRR